MVAAVLHRDEGAGMRWQGQCAAGGHVPGARVKLGPVGDQPVDFGHGGELIALDIGGAAGHQQPRIGPRTARLADRLAGLAHALRRLPRSC